MNGLPQFPGAVGFTNLRVYDSVAPDGARGGSPHVHLASAEAYIVTTGEGAVQTLGPEGFRVFDLRPGAVVWFEPGIVHRLVNASGDLEILCVMQNAGLPESGDAVLTFPDAVLADPEAYAASVRVTGDTEAERLASAARRRDLAVTGFETMLHGDEIERPARYERFLARAIALRQDRVPAWRRLWEERPLAEAHLTGERLDAIAAGSIEPLARARLASYLPPEESGFGMCGRLDTYLPEGWAP
jgi:mannose-6-phosphate isomerase-like protein (cupin superfamily)